MGSEWFKRLLRVSGLVILGVCLMHIALGLQADLMLGVLVSEETLTSAGLDSQNRFYGATFLLYGVLLLLVPTDLARYAPVLRCLLWVFWLAGWARFGSVFLFGWPPLLVCILFAIELVLPPLLLYWQSRLPEACAGGQPSAEGA